MSAAPEITVDARQALVEWLTDNVAPQLAFAVARLSRHDVEQILVPLSVDELYGLVLVLADRCKKMKPAREDEDAGALIAAVEEEDAEKAEALLTPLDLESLYALAIHLASFNRTPGVRPEDGLIDEVAIRRVAAGETALLTRVERDLAAHLMKRQGRGINEICDVLRISGSTARKVLYGPEPEQLSLLQATLF